MGCIKLIFYMLLITGGLFQEFKIIRKINFIFIHFRYLI